MKILVVEDDSASRLMLQRFLEAYGEVHTAINGRDAVASFHLAMTQQKPFDLVYLDILMPEMDGHEALRAIRDIDTENYTKVVMTTTLADADNVKRAIKGRCDAYIVKPVTRDALARNLRSLGFIG